jgi:hypothetical protein
LCAGYLTQFVDSSFCDSPIIGPYGGLDAGFFEERLACLAWFGDADVSAAGDTGDIYSCALCGSCSAYGYFFGMVRDVVFLDDRWVVSVSVVSSP